MTVLIGAGFQNQHTALLACATLTRMHQQLLRMGPNFALVSRDLSGSFSLNETIGLDDSGKDHASRKTFWKTLAEMLVATDDGHSPECADETMQRLEKIGVDREFQEMLILGVPPGGTGFLILVNEPAMRDSIQSVLRGFGAPVRICRLSSGNPETWKEALVGANPVEDKPVKAR